MTAAFAALFIALLVGHHLGDYLLQTTWQVEHKGDRGWLGWVAAAGHVTSYTAATIATAAVAVLVLHAPVTPLGFAAAQLFSAGMHLVIDRRYTLRWAMRQLDRIIPGKLAYYDNGGGAAARSDGTHRLPVRCCSRRRRLLSRCPLTTRLGNGQHLPAAPIIPKEET